MSFQHPVVELIKLRSSVRRYKDEAIPGPVYRQLNDYCRSQRRGPFGTECRFQTLEVEPNVLGRKIGTYGLIRGARTFIAGACKYGYSSMALIDFGYLFEKIILAATDLGLSTCWVGGIFNRSTFSGQMKIKKDEVMPAVSPVGYGPEKTGVLDRIIYWSIKAKKRKPWPELFYSGTPPNPLSEKEAGRYRTCLEMVRLSPSSSNHQPWRVLKEKGRERFHFYLQRGPGYLKYRESSGIDLQLIDMGIALCHLDLTAKVLQIAGGWKISKPALKEDTGRLEYIVSWIGNV